MAKKINKKKKVTIMQVKRKIRPFDLVDQKDNARIISAFLTLQSTEGWALFVQMIDANVALINEQILTKRDVKNQPLSDIEVDKLRDKREIYLELKNLPDETVNRKMVLDEPEDNDDPYYGKGDLPGKRDRP